MIASHSLSDYTQANYRTYSAVTTTATTTKRNTSIYRRRRCQEEAPRGPPAPGRSRTCWHSWVWPGNGWSDDSPSFPGGAAQWCHYLTVPRVWAPAPPPPVGKMSLIPAPHANLEREMVGWREEGGVFVRNSLFISLWLQIIKKKKRSYTVIVVMHIKFSRAHNTLSYPMCFRHSCNQTNQPALRQ